MQGRRHFLTMVGATAAASALHVGCSSDDGEGGNPIAGSNVRDVPIGTLAVARQGVVLGRDAGGLYAMTGICTHQQCDITMSGMVSGSGLECVCHGSKFNPNGDRIGGPATRPLKHFKVDLAADGAITIQTSTEVAADVRTAVPG